MTIFSVLVSLLSQVLVPAKILISHIQAGALENIVKTSQLEIIELQHSVDELRYFSNYMMSSDVSILPFVSFYVVESSLFSCFSICFVC